MLHGISKTQVVLIGVLARGCGPSQNAIYLEVSGVPLLSASYSLSSSGK